MAVLPPPEIILQSETFVIRRLVRGDASPKLESWIEDENAAAMINTRPRHWTVAEQAEFFAKREGQQKEIVLGIFPKMSTVPIGLFMVKVKLKHSVFVVSLLIGNTSWRGKDTTAESSWLVYDYFFNTLGYAKARANIRPENRAVIWHMYRDAWRKEARLTKHLRMAGSAKRFDLIAFGMLADEWRTTPKGWQSPVMVATSDSGQGT